MEKFELICPCHFGLESVLKKEILVLGYGITEVSDGRVSFAGDASAVVRANLCLRTAERVLLKTGSFHATTFEELFQGTKNIAWEEFFPENARFWVTKASSVKSKLFSSSDIQSVMKKAMVERMGARYRRKHFEEDGSPYPVRVFLYKDEVTCAIDTTGDSLHKRGYRRMEVAAPIAENLASALLDLTPWRADRILIDPFCGSGTFLIEAAMKAAHIAPGLKRAFTAERWQNLIPLTCWKDTRAELAAAVDLRVETDLQGYDIDKNVIEAAAFCAKEAGVEKLIHFQQRDVADLSHRKKYGFILTNPPYGGRIGETDALYALYKTLGERYRAMDDWSMYVITSFADAEKALGKKADKNRKLYNGMIKTYFYEYRGAKPPRRTPADRNDNH